MHAPLFPPNALTLVLPFWRTQVLAVALKLLLAALGVYLLARGCGLRRGPATFAATVYTFSAYMISWVVSPIGNSMAMCPWVLAMTGRVISQGRWRDAAGLAVAVGLLILGGHPETTIFTLGAAALFAIAEYARIRRERTETGPARIAVPAPPRLLLLLGSGVMLGVGLAAVTLFPFAQLLVLSSGTSRAAGPYGSNIAYAFFFPELWGNPSKLIGDFGPINYSTRTAYLGALPLLLAFGGVFARRPRGIHLEWILLTLLAALIMFPGPIHSLASDLPVLSRTDLLSTTFLTVLGGSILAGMGLQAWLEAGWAARRRMLIAIGAAALIPLVVLLRDTDPFTHLGTALGQLPALHFGFADSRAIKTVVAWRWIVFCAAGIAALLLVRRIPHRWVSLLAVAVVAVDLITLDRGYQPAIPLSRVEPPIPPALAYLEAHQGDQRISGTFATATPSLLPDLAERYGLRDIQTYNVPKTNRFRALWSGLGESPGDLSWWDPTAARAPEALNLFAVRYVLLPPRLAVPALAEASVQTGQRDRRREPDRAAPGLGLLRLAHGRRRPQRARRDSFLEHRPVASPPGDRARAGRRRRRRRRAGARYPRPERASRARRHCAADWLRDPRRHVLPGMVCVGRWPPDDDPGRQRLLPRRAGRRRPSPNHVQLSPHGGEDRGWHQPAELGRIVFRSAWRLVAQETAAQATRFKTTIERVLTGTSVRAP